MDTIFSSLYFYNDDTNKYPYDISYLADDNVYNEQDLFTDSWGHCIFYQRFENDKGFFLISKGEDGILFTKDDIDLSINLTLYE
jgi:hypothetical protein